MRSSVYVIEQRYFALFCGVGATTKQVLLRFLQLLSCKMLALNYRKISVKSIITVQMFLLFSLNSRSVASQNIAADKQYFGHIFKPWLYAIQTT